MVLRRKWVVSLIEEHEEMMGQGDKDVPDEKNLKL